MIRQRKLLEIQRLEELGVGFVKGDDDWQIEDPDPVDDFDDIEVDGGKSKNNGKDAAKKQNASPEIPSVAKPMGASGHDLEANKNNS